MIVNDVKDDGIKKIDRGLSWFFHSMFGILFGILMLLVMGVYLFRFPLCLPVTVIIGGIWIYFFYWIRQLREQDVEKRLAVLWKVLFFFMIAMQVYVGYVLRIIPDNDRNVIFQQAREIADTGIWKTSNEWNYYFLRYPSNRILLLLEAAYFSIVKCIGSSNYLMANILLNIAMIDLAILLLLRLVRKIWNQKTSFLLFIICFTFAPFYLFGPFVYTDSLTLPIVMGCVLLYYKLVFESEYGDKKILYASGLGILLWLGYELKATVAILLIAFAMHLIYMKKWRGIGLTATLIVMILLLKQGSAIAIQQAGVFDETDYETENFPYTHWIMMGLKGVGNYDKSEREFTSSFETREDKKEANLNVIEERLSSYGVTGLVIHQLAKGAYTWSNGAYDMEYYLEKQPLATSWMQKFIYSKGKYYKVFKLYSESIHLIMLLSMLVSIIVGIKRKAIDFIMVLKLAVFGLFLFLMVWETRPRYLMHYVPLMLVVALDGQLLIEDRLHKRLKDCCINKKKDRKIQKEV